MNQRSLIIGLSALLGSLTLTTWAMATPLSELGQAQEASSTLGSGYVASGSPQPPRSPSEVDGPTLSGTVSDYYGSDGVTPTGLGASSQSQAATQNWLRVRSHAGSSGDWPALTAFEVGLDLEGYRDVREDDGEQITVSEIARRFLRQEAANGRSIVSVPGEAVASATRGVDLGLDLVRNLLDHQMDRELALAALAHTTEIREFLLKLTESDNISDYEAAAARRGGGSSDRNAARTNVEDSATISSPELDRIKRDNQGTAVESFKAFILEFLTDFRILFFFGGSLMLILLLSTAVTRWGKA